MKILLILVMISCLSTTISASEEDTGLAQSNTAVAFREFIGKGVSDLWTWITSLGKPEEDTFVGRCFGIAKKIRQLLPIVVFKLGVIMTTLGFLTIFSLKSLALLVLLVIINSTGLISKLTSFKHHEDKPHAQNIHFHIHQSKNGHYQMDHSGAGFDGWDKSALLSGTGDDSNIDISDRLKRFNIYK